MKKAILIGMGIVTAFMFAVALDAQQASAVSPKARLAYADDETLINVIDAKGVAKVLHIGDGLLVGETIKTADTSAELELIPSGSIVRIAPKSTLRIDSLAIPSTKSSDGLNLLVGKIRVVAAKSFTGGESLSVKTPTAVGGVRGTDFAIQYRPEAAWICVTEGTVAYTRVSDSKEADVKAGYFLRAGDAAFVPTVADAAWLKTNLSELEFKGLTPPPRK